MIDSSCLEAKASAADASHDERYFTGKIFVVLTTGCLAWPDGWVDSEWAELHETPDAMPMHISVENQIAEDLHRAMGNFIEEHPQWDQYRVVQAAIAGFLFQQGCKDPSVVRHYLGGLLTRASCKL